MQPFFILNEDVVWTNRFAGGAERFRSNDEQAQEMTFVERGFRRNSLRWITSPEPSFPQTAVEDFVSGFSLIFAAGCFSALAHDLVQFYEIHFSMFQV